MKVQESGGVWRHTRPNREMGVTCAAVVVYDRNGLTSLMLRKTGGASSLVEIWRSKSVAQNLALIAP